MKVLITGAAGMLGVDVDAAAAANGHDVVALSRGELDISDPDALRAAIDRVGPDVVINCAAYTKVDAAEEDQAVAQAINGAAPGVLGAAAAAAGAWTLHVSTDYVFDGAKTTGPYLESDPVGPRSVYGTTKLAGELALAAAAPEAHTIVRSSWLFGAGGPCFPATILRAAAARPELKVVADQVGSPTYTPHLAAALLALAERRELVGVVHVAAAGETSWFGFASALVRAASSASAVVSSASSASAVASSASAAAFGDPAGGDGPLAAVRPCTTAEYPLPAPRPAFSVLRSERVGVPLLPDWRQGMSAYMADYTAARVAATEGAAR